MALQLPTEGMADEQVVDFILYVLEAHYRREARRIQEILSGFEHLNRLGAHRHGAVAEGAVLGKVAVETDQHLVGKGERRLLIEGICAMGRFDPRHDLSFLLLPKSGRVQNVGEA